MDNPHHDLRDCENPELHCASHNVDEYSGLAYHRCFECWHIFRTERNLAQAHNDLMLDLALSTDPGNWFTRGIRGIVNLALYCWAEFNLPTRWITNYVRRGRNVTVCPFCLHDFLVPPGKDYRALMYRD